jgi:hypothetical protein
MFFLRPEGSSPNRLAVNDGKCAFKPNCTSDGAPLVGLTQQHAESWQAIYRQAYDQLVRGGAPSAFQRASRPSAN